MTRIVSLNIRHGGGKPQTELASWLTGVNGEFLVLSEWRRSSSKLGAALESAGYRQTLAVRDDARANGLAVFCRHEFRANRETPVDSLRGELLFLRTDRLGVLAAYFPQRQAKSTFFDRCAALAGVETAPLLLIGDLNTGSNTLDMEPGGARFHCERDFLELSLKHGLVDLWRHRHGEDRSEWTWRSTKNGFRIDHAFGNQAFVQAFPDFRCEIDHSSRERGISDHSALIVDLGSTG